MNTDKKESRMGAALSVLRPLSSAISVNSRNSRQPILPASKYSTVPQVLVKKFRQAQTLREWWFKEIKEGGFLWNYVMREKHGITARFRAIQRRFANWRQPTNTDFQLRAAIPARLYHRLRQEDPHFFEDNENLRSLKRDNPDAFVKL